MRSPRSLGPRRNHLPVLAAALLLSALAGGSGASCAAGNDLGTVGPSSSGSGGAASTVTSSTSSSSKAASSSGSGGATASSSGSGGATASSSSSGGSGGAASSSSSSGVASSSSAGVGGAGGGGVDAGTDAGDDGGGSDGGTSVGVLVMLAGGGANVLAGEYHPGAGWTTSTLADATTDGPAVALTGPTSAMGLIRSTSGAGSLRSTAWAPGSWANFTAIGAGVTTHTTPSLVGAAGLAEAAFLGDDFKHYFASHQAAWAPVAEPVGGAAAQSFGPSPAAIAALGADAVVTFAGNNGDLYDQTRHAGTWMGAVAHGLGSVLTLTPAIIAPTTGPELMVVFVRKTDARLLYTTRTGGVWTAPAQVDVNALSGDPVALAALPGGKAVVAYRGTDTKLYSSRYDPAAMPPWTSPAAVFTPSVATPSTPALAPGLTGADAEMVYVDAAGGAAKHTRLNGAAWSAPVTIGGAGLTHAAASGLAM